jgi:geranylgeranyl pyrophosphate synthase
MFSSRGLVSREDYNRRIYAKTASMFELATSAAAVLSPADEDTVNAARQFGNDIGMAFQIVDDVLDFTGEQATVGKPVASDLRQGLVTLPAIYYVESHPNDGDMAALLNGQYYSEERLEKVVREIRKSGAIEQAMDEARHYIDRALDTLRMQVECPERYALEELAEYIVERSL